MKTIKEVFSLSRQYLENGGVAHARYSVESIIAHVLGIKRLSLYLDFDRPLTNFELDKIKELLKRRKANEPLDYIFGSCDFFNSNLSLTREVLIPRPETEELVALLVQSIKNEFKGPLIAKSRESSELDNAIRGNRNKTLWDICTGSGCIAIAIKKAFDDFNVVASDISYRALELAKANALKNNCQIDFRLGDLLDPFKGQKTDYLICNPPYISERVYETIMVDVKDFEPKGALVAEDEGLYFYKKFATLLPGFLNPGAKVFFEMGYDQKDFLYDIFVDKIWISKKAYKDLSGKDRFFFLEIE